MTHCAPGGNSDEYTLRCVVRKDDGNGGTVLTVLGAVIVPMEVDVEGEATTAAEIERQAHEWFRSGRVQKIDTNHNYVENGAIAVESFIARSGDLDFKPGTWVVKTEIRDAKLARKVESGELNAYSWAGPTNYQRFLTLVRHPIEASGTTEKCDAGPYPEHDHTVKRLRFRDDARVEPTRTETSHGHWHEIVGTTRTESKDGHSHGLSIRPE